MLLPIIMIILCLVGGGVAYFFIKRAEKNKYKDKNIPQSTANEFINVKDICGNFLYTRDGLTLCYLKLTPISIDLYSKTEKGSNTTGGVMKNHAPGSLFYLPKGTGCITVFSIGCACGLHF